MLHLGYVVWLWLYTMYKVQRKYSGMSNIIRLLEWFTWWGIFILLCAPVWSILHVQLTACIHVVSVVILIVIILSWNFEIQACTYRLTAEFCWQIIVRRKLCYRRMGLFDTVLWVCLCLVLIMFVQSGIHVA